MRVEQAYPGDALRHLRNARAQLRQCAVVYFTTGDLVPPGAYHCTFCGHAHQLRRPASLPLCPTCDWSEFTGAGEQAASGLDGWPEELALIA